MSNLIKTQLKEKIIDWRRLSNDFEKADYSNFQQKAANQAYAGVYRILANEIEAIIIN